MGSDCSTIKLLSCSPRFHLCISPPDEDDNNRPEDRPSDEEEDDPSQDKGYRTYPGCLSVFFQENQPSSTPREIGEDKCCIWNLDEQFERDQSAAVNEEYTKEADEEESKASYRRLKPG